MCVVVRGNNAYRNPNVYQPSRAPGAGRPEVRGEGWRSRNRRIEARGGGRGARCGAPGARRCPGSRGAAERWDVAKARKSGRSDTGAGIEAGRRFRDHFGTTSGPSRDLSGPVSGPVSGPGFETRRVPKSPRSRNRRGPKISAPALERWWERADAGRSELCLGVGAQSNARKSRWGSGAARRARVSAIRIATFAGAFARARSSHRWRTRIFLFDVLFQIGPGARSGRRRAGRRRRMGTNPTMRA